MLSKTTVTRYGISETQSLASLPSIGKLLHTHIMMVMKTTQEEAILCRYHEMSSQIAIGTRQVYTAFHFLAFYIIQITLFKLRYSNLQRKWSISYYNEYLSRMSQR